MKVMLDDSSLFDIADSIRAVTGDEAALSPSEMSASLDGADCVVICGRNTSGYPLKVDASHMQTKAIPPCSLGGISSASNAYVNTAEIILPDRAQSIGNFAFQYDTALVKINCPAELMVLGVRAFLGCVSLRNFSFGKKLRTVSANAFQNCTALENVSFAAECLPVSIAATAFSGCGALCEIRVPWSEGEIAGAPWGAENADIVYNCAG